MDNIFYLDVNIEESYSLWCRWFNYRRINKTKNNNPSSSRIHEHTRCYDSAKVEHTLWHCRWIQEGLEHNIPSPVHSLWFRTTYAVTIAWNIHYESEIKLYLQLCPTSSKTVLILYSNDKDRFEECLKKIMLSKQKMKDTD